MDAFFSFYEKKGHKWPKETYATTYCPSWKYKVEEYQNGAIPGLGDADNCQGNQILSLPRGKHEEPIPHGRFGSCDGVFGWVAELPFWRNFIKFDSIVTCVKPWLHNINGKQTNPSHLIVGQALIEAEQANPC